VPTQLELKDKEETFTIRVTYETQGLYGTVSAERTVIVSRE